jgi:hypothetical protein
VDLGAVLGQRVVALEDIPGAGGYTPALRQRARLVDGSTVFVKVPTNDVTRRMLEQEIEAYVALGRQPFAPEVLAATPEVLVLEDLSRSRWPPPWGSGDVDRVLATAELVAGTATGPLPSIEERWGGDIRCWGEVDVDAVAGLGFDRGWVARLTDAGREIEASATFDGDALLHMDLRSDNLCLAGDRVVLVDWNGACRGERGLDEAVWAPSLALEGGPDPWDLLPRAAVHHVAFLTGYFASRAPLPTIPDAPRVRPFQLAQLRVALPWFSRVVDVPVPA